MDDFKAYQRTAVAELREYVPGEDMTGVNVSEADSKAGSPKLGDMIVRNPKNHDDQWLVARAHFLENFAPMGGKEVMAAVWRDAFFRATAVLMSVAFMDTIDQDDAHRLRDKARRFLVAEGVIVEDPVG